MAGTRVAVIGAGAWGTALAGLAAVNGAQVTLWARRDEEARRLERERGHPALPGFALPAGVVASAEAARLAGTEVAVFATPAQSLAVAAAGLAPHLGRRISAIITAKGIDGDSGQLMHEVLEGALPGAVPAVLSGPSFAADVAQGLPTAVTLACADQALGAKLAALFARASFRPYLGGDIIGVELGGAVKNVLAIAAGIVAGRSLGESARAALIARGLAEMTRFGTASGAARETFSGLSGLGDLVLTAMSARSRNMALGMALAQGRALDELTGAGRALAEGVFTAPVVARLARERGVEMPIVAAVAGVVTGGIGIDEAIASLLERPLRSE